MFCYNCGKSVRDGALFCSSCGARLEFRASTDTQAADAELLRREAEARRAAEEAKAEEMRRREAEFRRLAEEEYNRQREAQIKEIENGYREQYAHEANKAQNVERLRSQAITAMILGIVSLDLAAIGIPGWVLSIIAKGKALPIVEGYEGTPIYGFAKAGLITAKVALPLSIVMAVFWTAYILSAGSVSLI